MTNYDKLKDDIVTLHSDKTDAKIFTVEGFVKYLNQTPQILDKVEKRYIRNIVAPFWKIVKYVVKITDATNEHYYINIVYTDPIDVFDYHLYLPSFDIDSEMYSNMEVDRKYTLEELGIKFK